MKFPGVEFLNPSLERERKIRRRMFNTSRLKHVPSPSHQEISRPSRAVTAKKCTKKCNARVELLFWLLSLLFIDVLVAVAVVVAKTPYCCLDVDDMKI